VRRVAEGLDFDADRIELIEQRSIGFTAKRFKDSARGFSPGNHPIKQPP
jgi:hypothetical protein